MNEYGAPEVRTLTVKTGGLRVREAIAKCADAIREEHASMMQECGIYKFRYTGASRLVRTSKDSVTYELWLRLRTHAAL